MLQRFIIDAAIAVQVKVIYIFAHVNDDIARADNDGFGIDVREQGGHGWGDLMRIEVLRDLYLALDPTHPLIVGAFWVWTVPSRELWANQPQIFRFRLGQVHI